MTAARTITFTLNGNVVTADVKPHHNLVELLQTQFGLTGARETCGQGLCGCCSVIVNGRAVSGCLFLAMFVDGGEVQTVESLDTRDKLSPVQEAFIETGAFQCGYCTPGFIMMTTQLLDENPDPTDEDIRHYLTGNLCRCATYPEVLDAVKLAAKKRKAAGGLIRQRRRGGEGADMSTETMQVETDVLIIGSGAAGMYAAIEAARADCRVMLIDRSLIGRGGATVMAQMTVAVALGSETPDHWTHHYQDTLTAGRGLCNEPLSRLLTEEGPGCIEEMEAWGVGWARKDGRITQAFAPGHDRPRCVYVDFLNTGPAVSKTLRSALYKIKDVDRAGDLCVVDLMTSNGEVTGVVAWHLGTGAPVTIAAKATIVATGGLTRLYARNSASANMGGDGYALCLRAARADRHGIRAVLPDRASCAASHRHGPDHVGSVPLQARRPAAEQQDGRVHRELRRAGGRQVRRDARRRHLRDPERGRGRSRLTPHGGAYLSFQHVPEAKLREAFGPVIDRLAANGIDLTTMPIEVAPIAHYHMGGVAADVRMETEVPGLLVAGEAVGGANGANRLSGNAITEALVFGREAGRSAARRG